ncbi:MAG TPA: FHIPEP family type III secretion protein [Falsiroseomonas sp.]|jgi:type III secretory pathway component EscV|nr:FHIPEP family type III secretion protein [Falsiroseomonas sp.]
MMDSPGPRADRRPLLQSLGIPDAPAADRFVDEGGHVHAAALAAVVDDEVAVLTWRRWNPGQAGRTEDPAFRTALRRWLAAGVAMGYALDRLHDSADRLPAPDGDDDPAWADAFEHAIAGINRLELQVHLSPQVQASLGAGGPNSEWNGLQKMMRDGLFYELGIVVPEVLLRADAGLTDTELRVVINDALLPRRPLLPAGRLLVNDTPERLALLGIRSAEKANNPASGNECSTVDAADGPRCESAGLTTWTRPGHAILTLSAEVRVLAGAFVNSYLVESFLYRLLIAFPATVREARRVASPEVLARLLRALVDEQISIRNLALILETLALPELTVETDTRRNIVFDPPVLEGALVHHLAPPHERRLMRVRVAMKRALSHNYTRGQSTLLAYLLDPEIEAWLEQTPNLAATGRERLVRAVQAEIGHLPPSASQPVLLTTESVRLRLRQALAAQLPHLAVLAYQELSPEMSIQPIARISMPDVPED